MRNAHQKFTPADYIAAATAAQGRANHEVLRPAYVWESGQALAFLGRYLEKYNPWQRRGEYRHLEERLEQLRILLLAEIHCRLAVRLYYALVAQATIRDSSAKCSRGRGEGCNSLKPRSIFYEASAAITTLFGSFLDLVSMVNRRESKGKSIETDDTRDLIRRLYALYPPAAESLTESRII